MPISQEQINTIFEKSYKNGLSGAGAMTIQVSSLMWLRTTMNYQYKYGGKMIPTIKTLYSDGGIPRFYRGIVPALMIGPISRFGDTATNAAAIALFENSGLPIYLQTASASIMAGAWRLLTIPIDTWKTSKQVHGNLGNTIIKNKMSQQGIAGLYQGALASSVATMVGHYPWFLTYNYLNSYIPKVQYKDDMLTALARNASIGFSATLASDMISNSVRVVKTYKQTHPIKISYSQSIQNIIQQDGIYGLLFRGLKTKIFTNGLQGIVFSVFYKFFSEKFKI